MLSAVFIECDATIPAAETQTMKEKEGETMAMQEHILEHPTNKITDTLKTTDFHANQTRADRLHHTIYQLYIFMHKMTLLNRGFTSPYLEKKR